MQVSHAIFDGVTDPDYTVGRRLLIVGGFLASGVRLTAGTAVGALGPRPEHPLRLWDFERCPYSRSVRETLSLLDLDAEVRPCPRGGTRFRPELQGGVPQLEDPNAGVTLTGSSTIIDHLHARYGAGRPWWLIHSNLFQALSGISVRMLTGGRGAEVRPSRAPAQPLELWSFESSPYSRMVRAALSELELPYLLHNVAKGSPKRPAYAELSGKMQVPYLVDPNTGQRLFGSLAIEEYLDATYAAGSPS